MIETLRYVETRYPVYDCELLKGTPASATVRTSDRHAVNAMNARKNRPFRRLTKRAAMGCDRDSTRIVSSGLALPSDSCRYGSRMRISGPYISKCQMKMSTVMLTLLEGGPIELDDYTQACHHESHTD